MSKNNKNQEEYVLGDNSVLAFIIDGEVVDTFVCDERLSAILQSEPLIVELEKNTFMMNGPFRGWTYDGKDFFPPGFKH